VIVSLECPFEAYILRRVDKDYPVAQAINPRLEEDRGLDEEDRSPS
jgi:hypothetical protein